MTDKPFHEHQAALAESQRHVNRAPMFCTEGVETPRRIPWGIVITAMIGIGFSLFLWGWANRANASEPPRTWVIWDAATDKQFHAHKFTSATACNVDIAHAKDGSGKRLACVRVNATKGE
jgi:hypothetical protein